MRNCVLIAYPFATLFCQGTGYEMINNGAHPERTATRQAACRHSSRKIKPSEPCGQTRMAVNALCATAICQSVKS
jgi:hypothetical protein